MEEKNKFNKHDFYNCLPYGKNICSPINFECPLGKSCISTNPNHILKFFHGSDKRTFECKNCLKQTSFCLSKYNEDDMFVWICKNCYLPYRCCDLCSYKSLEPDWQLSNCELSDYGLKLLENGELQKVVLESGKPCCDNCPVYQELDIHYKVDLKYKNNNLVVN